MNQTTNRTVFSVIALFIFMFIGFMLYDNFSNQKLKPKVNNLATEESLKRIAEEAEKYFEENQHFGILGVGFVGLDNCSDGNTFITSNEIVQDILAKFNESKCRFNIDENGSYRINNWNITVRDGKDFTCIDSLGKVIEVKSFPQTIACE